MANEDEDNKRRTNNPNATPTATNNPVATTTTQAEIAAQNQPNMMDFFRAFFGGQGDMQQQIQANKGATRKTVGGDIVDPRAPTGLDWLEANGPGREIAQQRQADLDAQLITPDDIQSGRSAVADLKSQQLAAGLRGPADETGFGAPYRDQVVQTPGSDVRVAYDQNGMPVGFSGATAMPTSREFATAKIQPGGKVSWGAPTVQSFNLPTVAGSEGGFSDAERDSFRNTANSLAASQSVARDAFGEPSVEVGPLTPETPTIRTELGEDYRQANQRKKGVFSRGVLGTLDWLRGFGYTNTMNALEQQAKRPASAAPKMPARDEFGYPIPTNY